MFLIACMSMSCNPSKMNYPQTKKGTVSDVYYGTKVMDPYRWLENDYADETLDWVRRQNEFTQGYINNISNRKAIKNRLTEVWNYERFSVPFIKGGKTYYFKNDGTQNQSVLYELENGDEKAILDPNQFSDDGTIALGATSFSNDGKYLAFEISTAGSDWHEIKVLDLVDHSYLEEIIPWVKFSGIAWQKNGFYYSRYNAPIEGDAFSGKNEFHKVYYHTLNTASNEDVLIFENKDHAQRNFYAQTNKVEDAVLVYGANSTSGRSVHIKRDQWRSFKTFDEEFKYEYSLVYNKGAEYYFLTNRGAPNNRIVKIDIEDKNPTWIEFIPEGINVLVNAKKINEGFLLQYTEDVVSKLYSVDELGDDLKAINLPGSGTISSLEVDEKSNDVYYAFENYTQPNSIYKIDLKKLTSQPFKTPSVDFNSADFVTKQVFYTSKDGTKIPMFITHKRGLELKGDHPTFLYAYGGFNISINPSFKNYMSVFLENGGVYAVANIRGGSEYGETWHEQGITFNKQNVFDDFIAGAEYLISEKYTNSNKLAVHGRSNGGLLIGAVMTQRPDLFKVCLPGVGVLDMLRYHQFTIGWAWAGDYGRSDDNIAHFKNLYHYSPLHNVNKKVYPATLITTGDHDDRVVPAHSFKFAATVQENQLGVAPVLIRIDVNAGHGAGKPINKQIDEWSDVWSFVFHHLEMEVI
jgi:prolyl oligopeptidase